MKHKSTHELDSMNKEQGSEDMLDDHNTHRRRNYVPYRYTKKNFYNYQFELIG